MSAHSSALVVGFCLELMSGKSLLTVAPPKQLNFVVKGGVGLGLLLGADVRQCHGLSL